MWLDALTDSDRALLEQIERANQAEQEVQQRARAIAIQTRHRQRRAKSEAVLAEILPAELEPETSYHVITHGDVDSLTYLRHIVKAQELDGVYVSTWCMALTDIEEITAWLESGRVGLVHWFVGEIFPAQYGAEYEAVADAVARFGGRLVVARNHSKVTLAWCERAAYFAVVESSANVNTNPRIEQTSITRNEDLLLFYRDFFDGLQSIDRGSRDASRVRPPKGGLASGDQ